MVVDLMLIKVDSSNITNTRRLDSLVTLSSDDEYCEVKG